MESKAKKQKNLFLSEDAQRLLTALSKKLGIGESAVIEVVIREKAKQEGLH